MDHLLIYELASPFLNYKDCMKLLRLSSEFRLHKKGGWLNPTLSN